MMKGDDRVQDSYNGLRECMVKTTQLTCTCSLINVQADPILD